MALRVYPGDSATGSLRVSGVDPYNGEWLSGDDLHCALWCCLKIRKGTLHLTPKALAFVQVTARTDTGGRHIRRVAFRGSCLGWTGGLVHALEVLLSGPRKAQEAMNEARPEGPSFPGCCSQGPEALQAGNVGERRRCNRPSPDAAPGARRLYCFGTLEWDDLAVALSWVLLRNQRYNDVYWLCSKGPEALQSGTAGVG